MAAPIANLAVMLTAKTGRFAADMNRARRPLRQLQSTARTVQRSIRTVFAAAAVYTLVRTLTTAVHRAREFRVVIARTDARGIQNLVRSYQALGHVFYRSIIRVVGAAAPLLENLLDKLTAASMWLEKRLTPQNIRLAFTITKVTAALGLAAAAMAAVVAVQVLWNVRLARSVVLQATLQALMGNWAALAVGAAVFAGTIVGINAAFGDLGRDAKGELRGIGNEVENLKNQMYGLGQVASGVMGIDFMPTSTLRAGSDVRAALDARESEVRKLRESVERAEMARRENANRRYRAQASYAGGGLF